MIARAVVTVLAGALFGLGLTMSSMIQPEVVLGFLRGQDMGLALVMGGAIAITLPVYQLLPRLRPAPLLGGTFGRKASPLDRRLVLGAAIFGIGWGICGVCPGPAITGLGVGDLDLLWALGGIVVGAWLQGRLAP